MALRSNAADLLRLPIVQFAIIGALLALVLGVIAPRAGDAGDANVITVTSADGALLQAQWTARWNRPPTAEELQRLIDEQVRTTVLYREAVALGLDRDDTVMRRMMAQKVEALYRDIVELSLSPTDAELSEYLAANIDRYIPPELITVSTVFVDPDVRDDRTLSDAHDILAELRTLERPTEGLEAFGDRFMLQTYYPERSQQDLAKLFGGEWAGSVFELSESEWQGPVLSGYGVHLVYVHGRTSFPAPTLEQARASVLQDWIDERRGELLDTYIAGLLDRYDVRVDDLAGAGAATVVARPGQ